MYTDVIKIKNNCSYVKNGMVKTDILGFGFSIREELSTMSMPCLYITGTQAYIIRACSCMSGRRWDIPLHLH